MTQIRILEDGTFVAVANMANYPAKIKTLKEKIKASKLEITQRRKLVEPLKKLESMKIKLKFSAKTPEEKAKLKEQIKALRAKHKFHSSAHVNTNAARLNTLILFIRKSQRQIEEMTEKMAKVKRIAQYKREQAKTK